MSLPRFQYMNFYGGSEGAEFVVHAKTYTKEQAVELFVSENDCEPTVDDVQQRYARWYVRRPDGCGYDDDGCGC